MSAELRLSNTAITLVDEEDYPVLSAWPWICLGGYAVRQVKTRSGATTLIYLHRQLLAAGPGEVVDHINNDRLDNRRSNLRLCTQSQNLANRPSPRATGYRGVYYEPRGGRWRAQIKVSNKNRYLGTYPTAEAAALAYDAAARKAFGRFARLNFPDRGAEQLALDLALDLAGEPDPFDAPAPLARADWFEISYYRSREVVQYPIPDGGGDIPW